MTDLIAVYGSLMSGLAPPEAPPLSGLLSFLAPCRLPGVLRDHGRYPGLFPDEPPPPGGAAGVRAELHRMSDPGRALPLLDDWEDFFPDDPEGSLYLRRRLALAAPRVEAWVYVSNGSRGDPVVPGGCWRSHVAARGR